MSELIEFTARANIRRFEAQLLTSSDEVQKATLRKLLAEQRQLLAERCSAGAEPN